MQQPACNAAPLPRSRSPKGCPPGNEPEGDRHSVLLDGATHRLSCGRRWRPCSAAGLLFPHPMSERTSIGYLTALTVSVSVPDGTLTVILSPFFLPTRARPTGDSTEMRPADGSLSTAPTRWYVSDDPSVSTTSMVEPGPMTLECDSLMICAL